jgi:hypothetical protein
MTRRINYEDDIFTLFLHVRCLQDTLKLEIDPELFRERVLGDIAWIDATIGRVYESLREGSRYVKRKDHLRELARLKAGFAETLDALVDSAVPFAAHVQDRMDGIRQARDAHRRGRGEIKGLLSGLDVPEDEHMVSTAELNLLMQGPEDEES